MLVLVTRGLHYFDPTGSWRNCLPRGWAHVSDGFLGGGVYHGFVVEPRCEGLKRGYWEIGGCEDHIDVATRFSVTHGLFPFIALWHVEHVEVEHVLAIACLMRVLERHRWRAYLEYLDTSYAFALIIGFIEHPGGVVELVEKMMRDPDVTVFASNTLDEATAVRGAIHAYLDGCRSGCLGG